MFGLARGDQQRLRFTAVGVDAVGVDADVAEGAEHIGAREGRGVRADPVDRVGELFEQHRPIKSGGGWECPAGAAREIVGREAEPLSASPPTVDELAGIDVFFGWACGGDDRLDLVEGAAPPDLSFEFGDGVFDLAATL